MQRVLFVLIVAIMPLTGTAAAYQDRLVTILEECPAEEVCVMMDIAAGANDPKAVSSSSLGYRKDMLSFHGTTAHEGLDFSIQTRTAHGTRFMVPSSNGYDENDPFRGIMVPSAGFVDGDPLIYTSVGLVRITNGVIRLGCTDCVELVSDGYLSGGPEAVYVTPSASPADFMLSYDENGDLFQRTDAGCVALANASRFSFAADEKCETPELIDDEVATYFGEDILPPCLSFYRHDKGSYVLRVRTCS